MSVIEQATNHYSNQERLIISVPEWGTKDNPLLIHVFPMTMAEVNMIQRISKKNASNIEHAANIIVIKARDAEGNRLFKLEDKDALMEQADYRVVAHASQKKLKLSSLARLKLTREICEELNQISPVNVSLSPWLFYRRNRTDEYN